MRLFAANNFFGNLSVKMISSVFFKLNTAWCWIASRWSKYPPQQLYVQRWQSPGPKPSGHVLRCFLNRNLVHRQSAVPCILSAWFQKKIEGLVSSQYAPEIIQVTVNSINDTLRGSRQKTVYYFSHKKLTIIFSKLWKSFALIRCRLFTCIV